MSPRQVFACRNQSERRHFGQHLGILPALFAGQKITILTVIVNGRHLLLYVEMNSCPILAVGLSHGEMLQGHVHLQRTILTARGSLLPYEKNHSQAVKENPTKGCIALHIEIGIVRHWHRFPWGITKIVHESFGCLVILEKYILVFQRKEQVKSQCLQSNFRRWVRFRYIILVQNIYVELARDLFSSFFNGIGVCLPIMKALASLLPPQIYSMSVHLCIRQRIFVTINGIFWDYKAENDGNRIFQLSQQIFGFSR
mmetsp:Transcript_7210/g.10958  ORF Transcript_7210/g.10958 Transcript_7210/m.10958 type:complete len:255 (-) Transcript_7210:165-929(-)